VVAAKDVRVSPQKPPSGPAPAASRERAPEAPETYPPAETYSGVLHVVFTPAPADLEALCSFWDVLEGAAGVGKVIAETPLADGTGYQFTVDLGSDVLQVSQLRSQNPRMEVAALAGDKLRIRMPSTAL
jgi:hypothetical protein